MIQHLLTLALKKTHMLPCWQVLILHFDVGLAEPARHLLLATVTRLLRSLAAIARLLLLNIQISVVVSDLILK